MCKNVLCGIKGGNSKGEKIWARVECKRERERERERETCYYCLNRIAAECFPTEFCFVCLFVCLFV